MKKGFFLLLFTILINSQSLSQNAGDLLFISYNADGNDGLGLVALEDIPASSIIHFNDNEWNGSAIGSGGAFNNNNETEMSWNSGTAIIPAGTVILFRDIDDTGNALYGAYVNGIVTGTMTGNMALAASNEVVYCFTGVDNETPSVFITAISSDGFTGANGQLNNTNLTAGINAVEFFGDIDVAEFTTLTGCNKAQIQLAIANTSNWITDNGSGNQSNDGGADFPPNSTPTFTICPVLAPGGIINELVLWLKADSGVANGSVLATDGQAVNTWRDQSGARTNDATDNNLPPPTFRNNSADEVNFNPVVDFDGVNDGLDFGNDYIFSSGVGNEDGITIFAVVEPDIPTSFKPRQFVFDYGFVANQGFGFCYGSNSFSLYTPTNHSGTFNGDNSHSFSDFGTISRFKIDFGVNQTYNLNGETTPSATNNISLSQLTTNEISKNSSSMGSSGPITIGRQSKSAGLSSNNGRLLDGSIAEIIVYKRNLTAVDIRRVESYLAIKWGITLDNTGSGTAGNYESSSGTLFWDAVSNSGFHNDVFGIGRDTISGLGQVKSKSINSSSVVIIEAQNEGTNAVNNFTEIAQDEFLMIGNNGLPATFSTTNPAPFYSLISDRIWKNQNIGNVGNVTLSFIIPNNGNPNDYAVHTDIDTDFTSGASNFICSSISGDTLFFQGVNLSSTEYFALGFKRPRTMATSSTCGFIAVSDSLLSVPLSNQTSLWFKANKGTSCNTPGCEVAQWDDMSSFGNNATQTVSANQPSFSVNTTNFNPSVTFDGTNSGDILTGSGINQTTSVSIFVVGLEQVQATGFGGSSYRPIFSAGGVFGPTDVFGYDISFPANNISSRITFLAPANSGLLVPAIVQNAPYDNMYNLYQFTSETGSLEAFKNGNSIGTNTATRTTGFSSIFSIGGNSTNNDRRYRGNINEVIYINDTISQEFSNQIQTYLAIKYGISLGFDYVNPLETVIYDVSNGFGNGVFGVGRSATFDFYQPKSTSETDFSGLTLEANINIGDENYLLIGHDNGALTRINFAGQTNVLTRKWYAEMTGGVGTVNLELDLAEVGGNTSSLPVNVKIGISNSATLANIHWVEAISVTSGIAQFEGINLYDKYFTFSVAP
ncbi:MAG: hypothetical protein ABF242_07850 [Flavobacteriales bacterium]